MRLCRRPDLHLFCLAVLLAWLVPGCRFDVGYIADAEVGSADPVPCTQEGGASIITREVEMTLRFVPEAGTTEYSVAVSFQPIDPLTSVPTGAVRHIRAPDGVAEGDASGLSYTYYQCVLQGAYEVTAVAVRRDPADSAPLFVASCEGQVTTLDTVVAVSQDTPFGPVNFSSCLVPL